MTRRDREIVDLRQSQRDAESYIQKRRDESAPRGKGADLASRAMAAAEIGAGALATGWIAGRTGTTGIGSVPIPLGLVAGLAGHAAAGFGLVGPKYAGHLANVSNGFLAGWLALYGAGLGAGAAEKAQTAQPTGMTVAGAPPVLPDRMGCAPGMPNRFAPPARVMGTGNPFARVPSPLSEAELQAMSARMPAVMRRAA